MIDYTRIIKKVKKINGVIEVINVGFISETHPVNLQIITNKGIVLYISNDKYDGWAVDYTRDSSVKMRSCMTTIHKIKNQTETIKVVERLINGEPFILTCEGYVS